MPPQSRGESEGAALYLTPRRRSPDPRSDPLLGFPSPATVILDQRTPTESRNDGGDEHEIASPLVSPSNDSAYNASVEGETPDGLDRDRSLFDDDDEEEEDDDDGLGQDYRDRFALSGDEHSQDSSRSDSESERDENEKQSGDNENDEFPPLSSSTSPPRINGPYGHSYHTLSSHPSSSSLSFSNHFAPPFYNRPPNPLPPSPSLTSLLGLPLSARTPFSLTTSTTAASTRPSTPTNLSDSEADFTQNDTDALISSSARRAPASGVPRAAPKVPTYEYYGFALYVGSWIGFLLYLVWSYTPSPILHQMGLRYYPNRWWSLAIPAMLVMTILYIYVALLSYNVEYLTLPMQSVECMVDECAQVAVVDSKGRLIRPARRGAGTATASVLGAAGAASATQSPTTPSLPSLSSQRRSFASTTAAPARATEHAAALAAAASGTAGASAIGDIKWRNVWSEGTDAVMDIPIGGVCEVLYGEGRDEI